VIGVLASGEGTNLQALIDAGLPIRAVASNRKEARALERARAAGIPAATFSLDCHTKREERDLVMATWLEEQGVEVVVLAGYMHLLTQPFLDRFPDGSSTSTRRCCPRSRERAIDGALAAGVETTGVTVHLVDEGVDTGRAAPGAVPSSRASPARADPRRRAPAAARGGVESCARADLRLRQDGVERSRAASSSSAASSSRAGARPRSSRSSGLR
jgi:phosphoribosylglycinamide formyltransferase-1